MPIRKPLRAAALASAVTAVSVYPVLAETPTASETVEARIEAVLANARVEGLRDQPLLIVPLDTPEWARDLGVAGAERVYKGLCGPDGAQATIETLLDHARRDLERDLGGDPRGDAGWQNRGAAQVGLSPNFNLAFDGGDINLTQNYLPTVVQAIEYIDQRLDTRVEIRAQLNVLDFGLDSDPNNDNAAGSAGTVRYLIPWRDYVEGLRVSKFRAGDDIDAFSFFLDPDGLPVRYDGSPTPTQETQVYVTMPQLRAIFGNNAETFIQSTTISLNSSINWRFNNLNCGNPPAITTLSLVDVLVHEFTHAMGFTSNIQPFGNNPDNQVHGLDVARFLLADLPVGDDDPGDNPRTGEGFSGAADVHYYRDDTDGGDGAFQTLLEQGDDAQPSHLQSASGPFTRLGIMDPFISAGVSRCPDFYTRADTEPLRNMGWRVINGPDNSADCNSNGIPDFIDIENGTSIDNDGDFIPDECEFFYTPDATPTTEQGILLTVYAVPPAMTLETFDPGAPGVSFVEQQIVSSSPSLSLGTSQRRISTLRFSFFAPETNEYAFRVTCRRGSTEFRFNDQSVYRVDAETDVRVGMPRQIAPQTFVPLAQGWHEIEVRILTEFGGSIPVGIYREWINALYGLIPLSEIRAAEVAADCDDDGIPDSAELDCDNDGIPDDCQIFDAPFPFLGEVIPAGIPGDSVIFMGTAGSSFDTEIALWQLGVFDGNGQHPLVNTNDNFLFGQQSGFFLNNPTPGFYLLAITGGGAEFGPLDPAFVDGGIIVNQNGCAPGGSINYTIGDLTGTGTLQSGRVAYYMFDIAAPSASCNDADLATPFGVLDLSDINAFIIGFTGQLPAGDLNNNGIWDLTDIGLFVTAFTSGCP